MDSLSEQPIGQTDGYDAINGAPTVDLTSGGARIDLIEFGDDAAPRVPSDPVEAEDSRDRGAAEGDRKYETGPNISAERQEDEIVVEVMGALDEDTGSRLVALVERAVVEGVQRMAIDLRGVAEVTEEGANALASCGAMSGRFSQGLHYRSDSGPGRAALLVAVTDPTIDSDLA